MQINKYGQTVGDNIESFEYSIPEVQVLKGNYCRLERINPVNHIDDLYNEVYGPESAPQNWTYLPLDSFDNKKEFESFLNTLVTCTDPYHFAIIDKQTNKALGTISLMRIDKNNGVIEVGYVIYSAKLKKTRIATEAQYLLASYVFEELKYRRYEWKCDSFNIPSKKAAERLGFTYEGCFRNAVVYKGRTRDTFWFSIIDKEWEIVKKKLELWLDSENFDEQGNQIKSLQKIL